MHSEHDVNILITEQGVADLRGKSPVERAKAIIENCAHPDYKNILWDYVKMSSKGQTPHCIPAALAMHEYAGQERGYAPDKSGRI